MARLFELINDIDDCKELWKVVVKVHHKWTVISNTKEHFEMILVDKEGTDIHVVVPTMYKKSFDTMLNVNNTYTIANFQVQLNDMVFKTSEHKFFLKFTGGTTVGDINKHEIPAKPIKFTSFNDIISEKLKKDMFIDVIGVVDDIGYTQIQFGNSILMKKFVKSVKLNTSCSGGIFRGN